MLAEMIRKEILRHLISMRFAIACVLCLFVMLTSFAVRSIQYTQVLDDYNKDSAADRSDMESWDEPWRMVWGVVNLHRGPNALKIFVRGVEARSGGTARLTARQQAGFVLPDVQNTAIPLFPTMDLVTFVGLILSLMAIVFGFDAVCGEKQQGTLRLMLSYSVPRDTVLLGKWIGGYVTLVMPYLLAVAGMIAVVFVHQGVSLTDAQWCKLAGIVGLSFVYLATVFSMALLVSCLCRRAETSIMVLSAVWVVLFLALPNLSPRVARLLHPTRGPEELANQRLKTSEAIWKRAFQDKMDAYDKENGFEGKWWERINWGVWKERKRADLRWRQEVVWQLEANLERHQAFRRIDEQSTGELDGQIRLSRWLARVSPFACFAMASAELADEGIMAKRRFLRQLKDFHPTIIQYSHEEGLAWLDHKLENEGKDPKPWPESRKNPIPRFIYFPAAGFDYVRIVAVDGSILAGLAVLFFLLSYMTFLRYDVR